MDNQRPQQPQPQPTPVSTPDATPSFQPKPLEQGSAGLQAGGKKSSGNPRKSRKAWWIFGSLLGALLLTGIAAGIWFMWLLGPVGGSETRTVEIVAGSTPSQIATQLESEKVIKSSFAFTVYTRAHRVQNSLQAGLYSFEPNWSLSRVVDQLVEGPQTNEIEITFLPGATLADNKKELMRHGYTDADIDTAFESTYDHPLMAGRPAGTDIEGYLFGETHRFTKGTSLDVILTRYFDDLYRVVEDNDLVAKYKQQGLSLYQGITLASIIQRESGGDDEAQIAQVFLLRLSKGISLGSDVTYQYIADKLGVARDVNLDNPYNTRRFTGLPPGPIAAPGVKALQAVGTPASGDYLYFLSGDDDITYFARTEAEHNQNIKAHCTKKCQII